MGDAFFLHDVLQLGGPHFGQEGVCLVQVMLLLGQVVQDEEEDGLQIHLGGQVPVRLFEIHAGADGLGHFLHILLVVEVAVPVCFAVPPLPDIGEGVVAPGGAGHVGEVQVHHRVAPALQVLSVEPAQVSLGVGHDQALLSVEKVGDHVAPGLAGPRRPHQQVVVVEPRGPGVVAGKGVFPQNALGIDVVIHCISLLIR